MTTKKSAPIFLVDDNPVSLNVFRQTLSKLGYTEINLFENSEALLAQLHLQPKIIFLDYHMHNSNGLDLLNKIQQRNANTSVVFVSGQKDIRLAAGALKYGAFDYIEKDNFNSGKINQIMEKLEWLQEMSEVKEMKRFGLAISSLS